MGRAAFRLGEVLALLWSDVVLAGVTVPIARSIADMRNPKTDAGSRTLVRNVGSGAGGVAARSGVAD